MFSSCRFAVAYLLLTLPLKRNSAYVTKTRQFGLDYILDDDGRDILAAGRDEDLLDAAGDGVVAVPVHPADISGVVPALAVERLPAQTFVIIVTLHSTDLPATATAHFVLSGSLR